MDPDGPPRATEPDSPEPIFRPEDPAEARALAEEETARRSAVRRGRRVAGALVLALAASIAAPVVLVVAVGALLLPWLLDAHGFGHVRRPPGDVSIRALRGAAWLHSGWVLAVAGLVFDSVPILVLGAVLLSALTASSFFARSHVLRVRVVRDLPSRAQVERPVAVSWRATNPTRARVARVRLVDPLGALARPKTVETEFPSLAPGDTVEATARVTFWRRGWKRLRPVAVTTRHPLGAFEASVTTHAPAAVLVRPLEGRVTPALVARLRGAWGTEGRLVSSTAGTDVMFGLRDWREGDDPRRIHWRTTARRRTKTFVEWRDEQAKRVVVVLARGARHVADPDSERAVSAAATVLRSCVRTGVRARLVLGDRDPRGGGGDDRGLDVRGRRGLARALDALAVVRWSGGRRPSSWLAGARRPDATTVVWVAAGDDPEADAAERRAPESVVVLAAGDPVRLRRHVRGLP